MKTVVSIVSCASGRVGLFGRHLDALAVQGEATACEYIVGIWGDATEHRKIVDAQRDRFANVQAVHIETSRWWPLPLAYNAALGLAHSDRLLIVGSDIVVGAGLLRWVMERPDEDTAWCFRVVRENGAEVVGLARKIAIPYCMTVATALVREAGGWDTTFCDGLCYEDNDFAARLLLAGVVYRWCDQFRNVHLSHKRYGGRERRDRIRANEQIWRDRIGGRPGSLWPLQGNGSPPDGVVGDGTGYQVSLRETLTGWGYPAKGKA